MNTGGRVQWEALKIPTLTVLALFEPLLFVSSSKLVSTSCLEDFGHLRIVVRAGGRGPTPRQC